MVGGEEVCQMVGGKSWRKNTFLSAPTSLSHFFLLLLCLVNVGHILQLFHHPFFMGFYVCFSFSMGWAAWSAVEV